jgi:hypothetical protein
MACGIAYTSSLTIAVAAITAVATATALASALCHIWQQRQLTRTLDRPRYLTLMAAAGAGNPPRADLAALGNEPAQHREVLVVDLIDLLPAVRTRLTAP